MLHEVDPPWGATISENNMLHEVDPPWGGNISDNNMLHEVILTDSRSPWRINFM
jgi:hypothetical protein